MLTTLLLMASAQASPTQATNFVHKFLKDDKSTYAVEVTGGEGGMDIKLNVEFEMTVKGEPKDGKSDVMLNVLKSSATFGGQEMPAMDLTEVSMTLDKHGAPNSLSMQGFDGVFYIAMLTRYLPAKSLTVGQTFKGDVKVTGGSYSLEGKYSGDEELEGKKYAIVTSKGTFTPEGDTPGDISSKNFYDSSTGKIVKTEATLGTPDGEFKMVVTLKKK